MSAEEVVSQAFLHKVSLGFVCHFSFRSVSNKALLPSSLDGGFLRVDGREGLNADDDRELVPCLLAFADDDDSDIH